MADHTEHYGTIVGWVVFNGYTYAELDCGILVTALQSEVGERIPHANREFRLSDAPTEWGLCDVDFVQDLLRKVLAT